MSLPVPKSNSGPIQLDPREIQALDAPLIALTNQCGGDLRRLMFAYFSFLNRRTDFYLVPHPDDVQAGHPVTMGFREGDAEKLLLAAFRQFPLRRIPSQKKNKKKNQNQTTPKTNQANTSSNSNSSSPPPEEVNSPAVSTTSSKVPSGIGGTVDGVAKKKNNDNNSTENDKTGSDNKGDDTTTTTTTTKPPTVKEDAVGNLSGVEYSEDGLQVPVGNGGSTKRYKWTQTIDECSVIIGLPKGLKGKDLSVSIAPTSLVVKSKEPLVLGNEQQQQGEKQNNDDENKPQPHVFVEGKLVEKIRSDESTWTLEGGVLVVTLDKLKKTYWKTVMEGDDEIDTELIDSKRHISEYDDATQGQIRKIIFDQNQERRGLKTSDEILGTTPPSPPPIMPPGVEYIDSKTVDENVPKVMKQKSKS